MNIDVVNAKVAQKLNIPIEKVKLVNEFYWKKIYKHFYSFDPRPLDISNVCVFYCNKYYLKKYINIYIRSIRKVKNSPKFRDDSPKKISYLNRQWEVLKGFLKIRKYHKYTN